MHYKMISFNSKITKKLLSYYFLHDEKELYFNQIAKKLSLDKRNLSKKLKEFVNLGLFNEEKKGNQKYYSLNKKHPLYDEYKKIVLKTFGVEAKLKELFEDNKKIEKAYIFGSYAENKMDMSSDIDVLIVGEISLKEVNKLIINYQQQIDRELNPVVMSSKEFKKREAEKDTFIENVFKKNIELK